MFRTRFEALDNVETFQVFFNGWLVRQDHYLQQLLQSVERIRNHEEDEVRFRDLIARVIAHYKQYYTANSKAIRENVFLVLSPTWLSSLERSFLWIAGFKPGLLFQLVENYVPDLSKKQRRRLERLAAETGGEERELEAAEARVQERWAGPVVLEAASTAVNGDANHVELVTGKLRSAMEELVEGADNLRVVTAVKVMGILNAAQIVRLLAAFAHFHRTIRILGMEKD